jgi:hypothetical protein
MANLQENFPAQSFANCGLPRKTARQDFQAKTLGFAPHRV